MQYNVISGDSHIDLTWLPADLFTANTASEWKDKVPRIVQTKDGPRWQAGAVDLGGIAWVGSSGRAPIKGVEKRLDRMIDTGLYEDGAKGSYRPTTPDLRAKDQDLDGVDAEVLYGIFGLAGRLKDRELVAVINHAYNEWLSGFVHARPERFAGLACLPTHEPEMAAAELRHAAKLGLQGGEFAVAAAAKPLYHRDWDILWAASVDCNMPIAFHTSGWTGRVPQPVPEGYGRIAFAASLSTTQLPGAEYLSTMIFSGALDRYPDLKFVLGECGATWIPYLLYRMNDRYEDQFRELGLSMRPSDLWYRHGYSTFQDEGYLADVVHIVGEDNVLWSSDFPHPDGVWPDSREVIQRTLGRLPEATRRKIVCENTGKLYGFIK